MNYDEDSISSKSQTITLFLCLLFGSLGLHRFYVGKYLTGILYLLIGSTSIVLDFFGIGYAFIALIAFMIIWIIDIYALYSDSFTDGKGRLVVGKSKALIYENLKEREQILFDEKLSKFICILLAIVFYVALFLFRKYF